MASRYAIKMRDGRFFKVIIPHEGISEVRTFDTPEDAVEWAFRVFTNPLYAGFDIVPVVKRKNQWGREEWVDAD